MRVQFAPKTILLNANVQSLVTWSYPEFSLHTSGAILQTPISVTLSVQNNTNQVVYVGVSYETLENLFDIAERKAVAAVPASATLRISAQTVPALASLPPNIKKITVTLISQAAGNVTTILTIDSPIDNPAGMAFVGPDERTQQDYLVRNLRFIGTLAAGVTDTQTYTVPAGKRAKVTGFFASIPQTPFAYQAIQVFIRTSAGYQFKLYSSPYQATAFFSQLDIDLEEGYTFDLISINANGWQATPEFSSIVTIKETF